MIKNELRDKRLMQKKDNKIKPIIIDYLQPIDSELADVVQRFTNDQTFIEKVKAKVRVFTEFEKEQEAKELARQQEKKKL